MDINDIVRSQGGIGAIARQLGISEAQAEQGAAALMPAILNGFGRRGADQAGGGLAGLGSILESLGGDRLSEEVVSPDPTPVNHGNEILGQIFGSKAVSREVAGEASQTTGLDPAVLKKMLPLLAMLAAGYLSSRSRTGGGDLGAVLGQVLGGGGGGLCGVLGSIFGRP